MRRINAIVLLFLYLSVNIDLQELMRVPFLFGHYDEHRQRNPEVDFVTFIVLHYFDDDSNDADAERHRQLPFKETHDRVPLSVAIPSESINTLPGLYLYVSVKHILYNSSLNCIFAQFNIWQPPKA
jgi:hypothetical protein